MNRDDIIRMAREAGCDPHDMSVDFSVDLDDLERFAALVAAAEREACAQICERIEQDKWGVLNGRSIPGQCSTAIRCGLFHAELEKEKGQK
jgi:hypothetical protein